MSYSSKCVRVDVSNCLAWDRRQMALWLQQNGWPFLLLKGIHVIGSGLLASPEGYLESTPGAQAFLQGDAPVEYRAMSADALYLKKDGHKALAGANSLVPKPKEMEEDN